MAYVAMFMYAYITCGNNGGLLLRINAHFIWRFLGLFKDAADNAVYTISNAKSSTFRRIFFLEKVSKQVVVVNLV
jgi:hypothetical protein